MRNAAGPYPFTGARVEGFDPVFDKMVRTAGDDPSLPRRPGDYAGPFFPIAADLVSRADCLWTDRAIAGEP
ncbi:MAG TPA: hypothetical protein VGC09_03215 [Rhodopila sp.]